MAAPKRTPAQLTADLVDIELLSLQGKNNLEISIILSERREYTLSRQQIDYDMRKLQTRWDEENNVEIESAKGRILAELKMIQKEYWDAWIRSQGQVKTITRKGVQRQAGKGKKESSPVSQEITEHIETVVGDPRFLEGVRWCVNRRAEIFGIDAPKKTDLTTKGKALKLPPNILRVVVHDNEEKGSGSDGA